MAKYSSKDSVFLIDGYNVLGVITQITSAKEAVLEETTPAGAEWETHEYTGINRAEVSQEGFFDDASNSVNDALNEKQGTERVLCLGVAGNTVGRAFTGFEGELQSNYTRMASKGAFHRANASYQGSGAVEEGYILHALGARTADGDTKSSAVEKAQSEDGGAAYLQVTLLDLGGYDSVTIRVLDSDGATWTTLATFTNVTEVPCAERVIVAGSIEKDLAVEWEFNGAGSDPSITFFVGFARY